MDRRRREEISAFLDGESSSPEAVERLLRDDPQAAAYHRELADLSRTLRSLEAPDTHPAFVTRVMAEVAETDMRRPVPRWLTIGSPAVALAAVLLVLAYTASPWYAGAPLAPHGSSAGLTAGSGSSDVGDGRLLAELDVSRLTELIEDRIASGEDASLSDFALIGPVEEDETVLGMELLQEIDYDAAVLAGIGGDATGTTIDVDNALADISEDAEEALREWLISYGQGATS